MGEELKVLLSAGPVLLLMAPSLIVGLVLILAIARLMGTLGKEFIAVQKEQAAAFKDIAGCVTKMKNDLESTSQKNDDIRITLTAISLKIDHIYDATNKRGN